MRIQRYIISGSGKLVPYSRGKLCKWKFVLAEVERLNAAQSQPSRELELEYERVCSSNHALEREVAQLRQREREHVRWVPVGDRLPTHDGMYFAYGAEWTEPKAEPTWWDETEKEWGTDGVTHWLEGVPPVPKEKGGK